MLWYHRQKANFLNKIETSYKPTKNSQEQNRKSSIWEWAAGNSTTIRKLLCLRHLLGASLATPSLASSPWPFVFLYVCMSVSMCFLDFPWSEMIHKDGAQPAAASYGLQFGLHRLSWALVWLSQLWKSISSSPQPLSLDTTVPGSSECATAQAA